MKINIALIVATLSVVFLFTRNIKPYDDGWDTLNFGTGCFANEFGRELRCQIGDVMCKRNFLSSKHGTHAIIKCRKVFK